MASKIEYYRNLSDETAVNISKDAEHWTSFLDTMGRVYKYPYHDQLMIQTGR